jgi:hypothetical protein
VAQGLQGQDGFHGSGSPQQMAELAFGGADRQMILGLPTGLN